MRKTFIVSFSLILFSMGLHVQAQEDQYSGNYLLSCWQEYQKRGTGQVSVYKDAYFRGFVGAVSAMLDIQERVDYSGGVINKQIHMVVGKYLEDHPESLHQPAVVLATRALTAAFPPKK
jgi:hypothetical protein